MNMTIIGCGNMGKGLAELLSPLHKVVLYSRNWNDTELLAKKIGAKACQTLKEALSDAEVIFLAIKPQNLKEIAPFIKEHLKQNQVLISLLVGTPLSILQKEFSSGTIIRIMPNLAVRWGAGIVGIVDNPAICSDLRDRLQTLLAPMGLLYWLKESQIDALASLAGSGPAFILTLIEAMMDAGVAMGFKAIDAKKITLQMMQGCLTMLEETKSQPNELKWQITSPGGTTIAGLRRLEKEHLRSGLIETFLASYEKAQEIAKNIES